MLGISVELGTYSIKFISYQVDKKSTRLLNTDEVIIDHEDSKEVDPENYNLWSSQMDLLKKYLDKIDSDFYLMMNIPSQIVTTRYLELPLKSKKKAYLMLPFQIEEDLPYSLNECTWAETLDQQGDKIKATVGIVKDKHFSAFYDMLKRYKIHPHVLTSDTSNFSGFIKKNKDLFPNSFSIINIGHETTRSFYFHQGELVSNHQSYIAGDTLTRAISKNYSISYDEATLYKHQNSFFLIEEQYDQVNENQKEFAKLMDTSFAMLLSEIKRWDIGFRVKYGEIIKDVYICGGTANVKNIQNYLSSTLNVQVHFFNPYQFMESQKIDQDEKLRRKFCQAACLALNATNRSKLVNFLKGELALTSGTSLPLESIAFIGVRTFFIALIVSVFLMAEFFIHKGKLKTMDRVILNMTKNEAIRTITPKSKIRALVNGKATPRKLEQYKKKIAQKEKEVIQEVKTIQSALDTNALSYLMEVVNLMGPRQVEVLKFKTGDDSNIELLLSSKKSKELMAIKELFEKDKGSWSIELKEKDKTLNINGKGAF